MKRSTVWLFIAFIGSFAMFLTVAGTGVAPESNGLLAQVGMSVGIPANPYNTLNTQLDEKQAEINAQAADLAAREAAFASSSAAASAAAADAAAGIPPLYLLAGIAAVAVLLMLNFYLDWRRSHHVYGAPPAPPEGAGGQGRR